MSRSAALLLAGAALLYLPFLGARDLWNPNEPTYGQAVVEMQAAGEWLVPTVNGTPFLEKPPLWFWLARASALALGGPHEYALRVPSALAGIALVGLTWLLAAPLAGPRRATLAGALLGTSYIVFWSARSAQMDLLLAACVLGAVVAGTRAIDGAVPAAHGFALAGVAIGLGFLAKGPVAIVASVLPLVLYAAAERKLRELARPAAAAAVAAFVAVAAAWVVPAWVRGDGAYVHEVVVRQTFVRAVAPWDHAEPWWYYLRETWVDLAPWSVFLPLAVGLPSRNASERRLDRLAWLWLAGLLVFFSLSASKRSPYLLPAWPAGALLLGGVAERWLAGTLEPWRRRACAAAALLLGVALAAAGIAAAAWAAPRWPLPGAAWTAIAVVLVAAGIVVLAAVAARARRGLAATLFGAVVATYGVASAWVLPAFDAYKSARPFGERIAAEAASGEPVSSYGSWEWRAGYAYYARRPIARLASIADLARYWGEPRRALLVVEGDRLAEARRAIGDAAPIARAEVGSRRVALFANRPP